MDNQQDKRIRFQDLDLESKQNLVNVFAWLIQQDKKQNPELYTRDEHLECK